LAESANFKGGTFNKLCNGLIGNRFEMQNVSYTHPLEPPFRSSRRLWDRCGFAAPLSFGESGENGEQAGGLRILFA